MCFKVVCRISGAIARSKKIFLHTDAAQATGKVPIDVNAFNIDLMSISGHKIYGPKGESMSCAQCNSSGLLGSHFCRAGCL